MAWLAVSGIDLSAIATPGGNPKSDRRDIGDVASANDGSIRITRQMRKHDVTFDSIPLSSQDAFVWEALLSGAGQVWNFDTSYYSSKGLVIVPDDPVHTSVQAVTKKYGAGALKINTGSEFVTTSALGLSGSAWTQAVWWNQNGAGWHHIVKRSDGTKWIDGVISGGGDPFGAGVVNDTAVLNCVTGPDYFDDWIVMPGLWPTTWAPLVFALGSAFSQLPFLDCAGSLVKETSTVRRMLGKTVASSKILRANPSGAVGGLAKDVQVLHVELQEA